MNMRRCVGSRRAGRPRAGHGPVAIESRQRPENGRARARGTRRRPLEQLKAAQPTSAGETIDPARGRGSAPDRDRPHQRRHRDGPRDQPQHRRDAVRSILAKTGSSNRTEAAASRCGAGWRSARITEAARPALPDRARLSSFMMIFADAARDSPRSDSFNSTIYRSAFPPIVAGAKAGRLSRIRLPRRNRAGKTEALSGRDSP